MNWKKRGLTLMLALALALSLTACGNKTSDDTKEPEENAQEEMQQSGEQSTAHGGEEDEVLTETEDPQEPENLPARRESRELWEPAC